MASWYSNLLTRTTSQISSLRATLLASDADGDGDDDTHVCRVLRNYYADRGRPLPPWLPPDPKAAAPPQPLYAQPAVGARYGAPAQPQQLQAGAAGGLSSLWDAGAPASPSPAPQSLRAARTPPAAGPLARPGRDDVLARPLPSQRAGSYQNAAVAQQPPPHQQQQGASAQDRLRQRLRGGASSRTSSPSHPAQSPFQPPPPSSAGYEDRFASPAAPNDYAAPPPAADGRRQGLPGASRRQGLPSGPRGYR